MKKLQRGCLKCILHVHLNVWCFFWKRYISFHHFRNMNKKLSNLWRTKNLASLFKIQSGCRRVHFEKRQLSSWKKIICPSSSFLVTRLKFFENFGENIPAQLSKLRFTCPWEEFEKIYLCGENNPSFNFELSKKNQAFCQKNSSVVKTAS